MKRIPRPLILGALALLLSFGCDREQPESAQDAADNKAIEVEQTKQQEVIPSGPPVPEVSLVTDFEGLHDDEVLEVALEKIGGSYPGQVDYELTIYALPIDVNGTRRLLGTIRTRTNVVRGVISDRTMVFSHDDGDPDNLTENLWRFLGDTGAVESTGFTCGLGLAITDDGRHLCWVYPEYIWQYEQFDSASTGRDAMLSIPVIYLHDFETGETRRYDFSDSHLADSWGVTTSLEYRAESQGFWLQWSLDAAGNYGKGIISLDDFEYHPIE